MTEVRSIWVRLRADVSQHIKEMHRAGRETEQAIDRVDRAAARGSASIDRYSGRLGLIVRSLAAVGPAAVPITTATVPAITGLATQLGFAATAAGVSVLAFQGVGDALKAVRKAELEPTVANLEKAREAMQQLSPAGRDLVGQLREMAPAFREIRDAAQGGLFPGVVEGLDSLEDLLPRVERIVSVVADATGDLFAAGVSELASDEWADYFDFIESEARPQLVALGHTVGNLTKGLAEMWMASDPLIDDFTRGLLEASRTFEDWAEGLEESEDFQEFLDYVRDNGPQVLDTLGSIGDALLEIVEAASPLGGPVLVVLEAFADTIATIADSPIGSPLLAAVAATSALTLVTRTFGTVGATAWAQNVRGANGYVAAMGAAQRASTVTKAGIAALAISSQESLTGIDATNTAMGVFAGAVVGGPWGAAIGGAIGLVQDFGGAYVDLGDSIDKANQALTGGNLQDLERQLENLAEQLDKIYHPDVNAENILGVIVDGISTAGGVIGEGPSEKQDKAADALREKMAEVREAIESIKAPAGEASSVLGQVFGPALGLSAEKADDLSDSILGLEGNLSQLDRVLSRRAAWRAFEESIDAVNKAVEENGKTLAKGTAEGRANQEVLDGMADATGVLAEKLEGLDRLEFLERAREHLIRSARAFGLNATEAEAFVNKFRIFRKVAEDPVKPEVDTGKADKKLDRLYDQLAEIQGFDWRPQVDANTSRADRKLSFTEQMLKLINGAHPRPEIDVDNSGALAGIGEVNRALANIDLSKTVTVTVKRVFEGAREFLSGAQGNFLPAAAYATGGMDRPNGHMPEFAGPGPTRIWREPETGGESYIPHANDSRRPRARAIAERTVNLFGGEVQWHAMGSVITDGAVRSGGSDRALASEVAHLRSTVGELRETVAGLGGAVERGARTGSYHGTSGRLAGQGQDVYLQTEGDL